jgi:hypothetical protein
VPDVEENHGGDKSAQHNYEVLLMYEIFARALYVLGTTEVHGGLQEGDV